MFRKFVSLGLSTLVLASSVMLGSTTGPSSSHANYIEGSIPGVDFVALLTAGDSVKKRGTANDTYRMVGIPDGLGAFDNLDGTITVLMNHELTTNSGVVRKHGGAGAFVSRWQIRKSDLKVLNGMDQMERVMMWDATAQAYSLSTSTAFSRFCSADLPSATAFFNSATGKGLPGDTLLYLNGEEDAAATAGRAMAHVVTGKETGTSYEIFKLGRHAWENVLANPYPQDTTILAATEDGGLNKVFFYVGQKQETGNPVDMAGLTNGTSYELLISGYTNDDQVTGSKKGKFSLVASGGTSLARPEDGAWDPTNPARFYFVTTASITGNSRLWKMTFNDITKPTLGGSIEVVVEGGSDIKMMDNITIDDSGRVYMLEDVGNDSRLGRVWSYGPEGVRQLATHSPYFFGGVSLLFGNAFETQDEEASGIIDVTRFFTGEPGFDTTTYRYMLLDSQVHAPVGGEIVERGQLLMMRVPRTLP